MEAVTAPGVLSRSGRIVVRDSSGGPNTHRLAPYARPESPLRHMRKYSGYSLVESMAAGGRHEWCLTPGCGSLLAFSRWGPEQCRLSGHGRTHVTELYGYEMRDAASCDVGPDTLPLSYPYALTIPPGLSDVSPAPCLPSRGISRSRGEEVCPAFKPPLPPCRPHGSVWAIT